MKVTETALEILTCNACESGDLVRQENELRCTSCGSGREIWEGMIIRDPALEADNVNAKDAEHTLSYESNTKHRYQSDHYARNYLNQYKNWYKPKNVYSGWIALREREAVATFISSIEAEVDLLLDLPAGSGKLSNIHQRFDYNVLPADVSFEMLKVGMEEWRDNKRVLGMVQMDATHTNLAENSIDTVVCLRLMHRLNAELNRKVLTEFKRISKKYMIVSYSVNNFNVADILSGKSKKYNESDRINYSAEQWRSLLGEFGTVIDSTFIRRGISREVVTLVDVRNGANASGK